ncbi:MAG TPA: hypothetical protein VEU08_06325, partial [Vicinamibacterales bacterium]|nr:hypothetical protein [Vicinamibacterales bacterium]
PDQALRYTPGGVAGTSGADAARPTGDGSGAHGQAVWVLRDGRPTRVPVTIGLDDDTNAEVTAGSLKAGDQVIVSEETTGSGGGRQGQAPRLRF